MDLTLPILGLLSVSGYYFTKEEFGYFGLANMIVLLPISFVSQSVGSIFFQKVSECYSQGDQKGVKKSFYQTFLMLLIFALPIFLMLFLFGEEIFIIVFGENWQISGKIAKNLSLVFLFQLVASPLGVVLLAIDKVKVNSYWQYGRFLFMAIVMYLLINVLKLELISFFSFYSISISFVYVIYLLIIVFQLKKL